MLTPVAPAWADGSEQVYYALRRYFGISVDEAEEMPLWERELLIDQLVRDGEEPLPDDPFAQPPET